jgi:hypothetical protein
MSYKSIVSALTALNATETNKTLIDTITVPQGVRALVAVLIEMCAGTAGQTTLENISGILELESDDMSPWGGTQAFVTGVISAGSAAAVFVPPVMHPTNIPVTPGSKIKGSMTMDLAITINNKARFQLVFE